MRQEKTVVVSIPDSLSAAVGPALVRLGYRFPAIDFIRKSSELLAVVPSEMAEETLRREVLFAVYQESILQRSAPLRDALAKALLPT